MRKRVKGGLLLLAGFGFLIAVANEAQAWPDSGANCAGCHRTARTDAMAVTNFDGMIDLDAVNLGTATDRGPLKYFDVVQGSTVTLSLDVLNGADLYAVKLNGLDGGGVMNDVNNKLIFSDANDAGNPWTDQGGYFTKDAGNGFEGISWSGSTTSFTFDLFVDAATPLDTYDLEFAVAGVEDGRWNGSEHFYLNVKAVPEPASWVLFSCCGVGLMWYVRRRKR